jgi:hypothetical protein
MRILNSLRKTMLNKSRFTKYLLYAFGEIVLVVIGILIALWVNRSNEESKLIAKTEQIGAQVLKQLQKDISEIDSLQINWDEERMVADTILRLTQKDRPISKTCRHCPVLITGASIPTLTNRIPNLLGGKDLYESELLDLLNEIEFHYLEGLKMSDFYEKAVIDFTTETLKYWQNTYPWFADLSSRGSCPDDCMDYFYKSVDYRNRVAYYELILLDGYYYEIDTFKNRNKGFAVRLEEALKK